MWAYSYSIDSTQFYWRLARRRMRYGSWLQELSTLWSGNDPALGNHQGQIVSLCTAERFKLHPSLHDTYFQPFLDQLDVALGFSFVPMQIDHANFFQSLSKQFIFKDPLKDYLEPQLTTDIDLFDVGSNALAECNDFQGQSLAMGPSLNNFDDKDLRYKFQPLMQGSFYHQRLIQARGAIPLKNSTRFFALTSGVNRLCKDSEDSLVLKDQKPFTNQFTKNSNEITTDNVLPAQPKKVSPNRAHQLVTSSGQVFFQEAKRKSPAADEIEIELHSVFLSRHEKEHFLTSQATIEQNYLSRYGPIIRSFTGRVSRIGQAVDKYRVGNNLVGCAAINVKSHATVPVPSLITAPPVKNIDFCSLAAIPETLVPMYYALSDIAKLNATKTLLIIGLDSALAPSAAKIAAHLGAKLIAATKPDSDKQQAESLNISNLLNLEDIDFVERVKDLTNGLGADVIVNLSESQNQNQARDVLAPFGRYLDFTRKIDYGNGTNNNFPIAFKELADKAIYVRFEPSQLVLERPKKFRGLLQQVLTLVQQGKLLPNPIKQFSSDQIQQAFAGQQHDNIMENCILKFRDRPVVSVYPEVALKYIAEQTFPEDHRLQKTGS